MSFSVDESLTERVLNIMMIKFAEKNNDNIKFQEIKTSFEEFLFKPNEFINGYLSFDDFRKLFPDENLTDGEIHQFCINNNYEVIF